MPDIKFKTEILEAIDALRLSKNRPNLKRISNYVRKRYLVSPTEFRTSLKKCLDSGDVFAVDFKGCTSFRNAAKSKHGRYKTAYTESGHHNHLMNSIIKLLQKEVYKQSGLSVLCIKRVICAEDTTILRQYVISAIKRGLYDGVFIRLPNKNIALKRYYLDVKSMDTDEDTTEESKLGLDTSHSPDSNKEYPRMRRSDEQKINLEGGESGIVSGRRKRSKKIMFDPSDNHIPRKRGKLSTILPGAFLDDLKKKQKTVVKIKPKKTIIDLANTSLKEDSSHILDFRNINSSVCVICLLEVKSSVDEPMILCKNCSHRAHISCLHVKDGMFRMGRDGIWACPRCKTCVVCFETSEAGRLTVCTDCTDPYHALCHAPRIRESYINSNNWQCCNCKNAGSDSALSDDSIFFNEEKSYQIPLEEIRSESVPKLITYSNKRIKTSSSSILPKIKSQQLDSNCSTTSNCQLSKSETPDIDLKKYSYFADYLKYKENHEKLHGMNITTHGKYDCDEKVPLDPTIPDARKWTVDDVYHYFARLFPEDAIVFKKEKIDGLALLLMNRNNIVEDLKLSLGVSLKIYRHVVLLQERRENTRRLYL